MVDDGSRRIPATRPATGTTKAIYAEHKAHRCRDKNAMNSPETQSRHSVQRMVRRMNRVRGYMEARGFRVGRGTYDPDGINLATVDIDRLDAQETNGAWTAYERSDSREAVWAIIVTAREALKRFAPNAPHERPPT